MAEEAAQTIGSIEVGMRTFLRLFERLLKLFHPHGHEMNVLQKDPSSLLDAPLQCLLGDRLLALAHGNIDEEAVFNGVALFLSNGSRSETTSAPANR